MNPRERGREAAPGHAAWGTLWLAKAAVTLSVRVPMGHDCWCCREEMWVQTKPTVPRAPGPNGSLQSRLLVCHMHVLHVCTYVPHICMCVFQPSVYCRGL